jgi:hypothetical protein
MIRLFDACIASVALLVQYDTALLSLRKSHIPMCYRLAHYLENTLLPDPHSPETEGLVIDLGVQIANDSKTLVPDILLHDRNQEHPTRPLAIMCKEDYLTEQELEMLYDLKSRSLCNLPLAIAFLPQKPYVLIYRADEGWIHYYHFDVESSHCSLIRRREMNEAVDDSQQLRLAIKHRRHSKSQRID